MTAEAVVRTTCVDPEWDGVPVWSFTHHDSGYQHTVPLALVWEISHDWITDDYVPEETSAEEMWRIWLDAYPREEAAEAIFGPGARSIRWFVEGPGHFEGAPGADTRVEAEMWRQSGDYTEAQTAEWLADSGFLRHFTWPVSPETGRRVAWKSLPVIDKLWRTSDWPPLAWHKGGFIQEATGWKPGALQPYVDIRHIASAAGLYLPEQLR
jgi:hypothetical protein